MPWRLILVTVPGIAIAVWAALLGRYLYVAIDVALVLYGVFAILRIKSSVIKTIVGRNPDPRRTLILNEESILIKSSTGETKVFWNGFSEARELADVYLLIQAEKSFPYPVPKRAFTDPAQERSFRELLFRRGLLSGKI